MIRHKYNYFTGVLVASKNHRTFYYAWMIRIGLNDVEYGFKKLNEKNSYWIIKKK